MNKQKELWDKLAIESAKNYICSSRHNNEENFRQYGMEDYQKHICDDTIIHKFIPDFSVANILEIGCGVGRMTEFMAKDFKAVFAVDISGEMIKQGEKRLEKILNIKWLENDGQSFSIPDNTIDMAFSFLVFQHIPDKKVIKGNFCDIHRVLKQNGIFKVRIRSNPTLKDKWYSGAYYNLKEAQELCNETSFEIIKQNGSNVNRFWLWLKKQGN